MSQVKPDPSIYSPTPGGRPVGQYSDLNTFAAGECIDGAGDIFITTSGESGSSTIYEYAHGDSTPLETLSDPGTANGCAIDPTTGNLAVTNVRDVNNPYYEYRGDLAVYRNAEGEATMYYSQSAAIGGFYFCGFDDKGNLYLTALDEYDAGDSLLVRFASSSFTVLNTNDPLYGISTVQWDGKHVTVSSGANVLRRQQILLYRLRIKGSTATVIGTTTLSGEKNKGLGQSWIQGGRVIVIGKIRRLREDALLWQYPNGGEPRRALGWAPVSSGA